MSSQLLIHATGQLVVLVVVLGMTVGAKALASVLRTWIEQASRTRRLNKALENSRPNQRPGIILACSQLEARVAGDPDGGMSDEVRQAHGRPRSSVATTTHDKCGRQRRKD